MNTLAVGKVTLSTRYRYQRQKNKPGLEKNDFHREQKEGFLFLVGQQYFILISSKESGTLEI